LLTSNPGFADDLGSDSAPTLMMARFNEERDDASDMVDIQSCTNITADFDCLYNGGALGFCEANTNNAQTGVTGLVSCLQIFCPNTSDAVIDCVSDPIKTTGGEGQESTVLDPCTAGGGTSSDQITCIEVNFDSCTVTGDPAIFGTCMTSSCPTVGQQTIDCITTRFRTVFGK
jgi:hypothetical protein